MTADYRLDNATIIRPTGTTVGESLLIDDGVIVATGYPDELPPADEIRSYAGKLLCPGFIDPHVHIGRDNFGNGTWEEDTKGAALGGITTAIGFVYDWYAKRYSMAEEIQAHKRAAENGYIDFSFHAALSHRGSCSPQTFETLEAEGITSIKAFMSTYDFGVSDGFLDRILEQTAIHDFVATVHTENESICDERASLLQSQDKSDPTHFPASRPPHAEAAGADTALRMAEQYGTNYYGMHTTCKQSAETLAHYRSKPDTNVRTEARVAELVHTEALYETQGNKAVAAPPLRTQTDQDSLYEHLESGTIDHICTDHCSYCSAAKTHLKPWWDVPLGVGGIQFAVPLLYNELIEQRDVGLPTLVRLMSTNPAQTFGMDQKGTLAVGTDADITILDPTSSFTIRDGDVASESDYTIYNGMEMPVTVSDTMVRGEFVVEDEQLCPQMNGHAEHVDRTKPDWS